MQTYQCCFLDDRDHISSAESFDAEGPADALERALAMLSARPHHRAVEVWFGARRLYLAGNAGAGGAANSRQRQ